MAGNVKQKIEDKPAVQLLFATILHEAGVTDQLMAQRVREGFDATVVARETKYARREVLIDFSERREMVELAGKFKGHILIKQEVETGPKLSALLEESFSE